MPIKTTSKLSGKTVRQKRFTDSGQEYFTAFPTESVIRDTSNFFPITTGDFGKPIYATYKKDLYDSLPENVKVREYLNNRGEFGYSDSILKKLSTNPPSDEWLRSQPRPQFPGLTPGQAYGGMIPSYGFGSWMGENEGMATGVATGAASGAATGAALGPWGAAVGGVIGGVAGGISGHRKDKARAAEEDAIRQQGLVNQQMNAQMIGQNRLQDYNNQPIQSYGAFAANGGYIKSYYGGGMLTKPKSIVSNNIDYNKPEFPYDGTSMYKGGYDMKKAMEIYSPDEFGHMPSVDYRTGEWLKDKDYPTSWKEFQASQLNLKLNKEVGHPTLNKNGKLQYNKGYAGGGYMEETRDNPDVTYFANGGTHEQNPNSGIPLSNRGLVEQGEVKVKLSQGDYIFSNRF